MLIHVSETYLEGRVSQNLDIGLKPIFHCYAKLLALGTFAIPDAKDDTFALPDARIPTCWYLLYWVTHTFRILPDAKPKSCVLPNAKPKRMPVEYRLRWVPGVGSLCWGCTFHIFVLISFEVGSRRKRIFQWNMGFSLNFVTCRSGEFFKK